MTSSNGNDRVHDLFDKNVPTAEAVDIVAAQSDIQDDFSDGDINLSDLDRALIDWARRHGADTLTARAFGLANWAVMQGHTCLGLDSIPTRLMSRANQRQLRSALASSSLVGQPGDSRPLIVDNNRLYLQRYHAYETRLAERLSQLLAPSPAPVDIARLLPGHGLFETDANHPEATNWQAVAAFAALRHRFTVISGGPGTGKTYSIVRLLRVLIETALADNAPPPHIALAAPTGKAAARMVASVRSGLDDMAADPNFDPSIQQHVPQTARTLHRLLGLTGATTQPRFHADNPLAADVVIIDEASMVDLPMMAKLAAAIGTHARLILLGDRYQLASVESGSVLAEICAHAGVNQFTAGQQQAAGELITQATPAAEHVLADHVVTLQTSRRFNTDSAIGQLAAAVNAGDAKAAHELLTAGQHDLLYRNASDTSAVNRLMDEQADHYAALIQATDPTLALAQLGQQCILTAVRGGPAGSQTINAGITERLAQRYDFRPNTAWYHGRPVMITRNDYRAGLYNGDMGIALYNDKQRLRVWFTADDGLRAFLPSALPSHETVYAMTIHKSQGSEFDAVTLVLPDYDVPVLTRELLYTGLTRARNRLAVHAHRAVLQQTIGRRVSRLSSLAERIGRH